jgi:CheY-like chemotaxis protein
MGTLMDKHALVLLVEDDPDLREIERLLLGEAGYRVETAAEGREALAVVEREQPALILLDMRMPGMDGTTFAHELHARHGHSIPLVVVTAAEDARGQARRVEAEGYLGKPFDVDTMLAAVERHGQFG